MKHLVCSITPMQMLSEHDMTVFLPLYLGTRQMTPLERIPTVCHILEDICPSKHMQ